MADEAGLYGSLRAFTEEDFEKVWRELRRRAEELQDETGAKFDLELTKKIPPIINDPLLVEKGSRIGRELFGEKFYLGEPPFLVGDNAAYYMEEIPGMRTVFLAGKAEGENYPVHHPGFDIEEPVMEDALEFLYRFCTEL